MNTESHFTRYMALLLYMVAISSLLLSIVMTLYDKIHAATFLGAVFLVTYLLAHLPHIESLKAFTVEVKLRKQLDRADDVIRRTRDVAVATARLGYHLTAYGNRYDGAPASVKQATLSKLNEALRDLEVKQITIDDISKSYVKLIGWDLYLLFFNFLRRSLGYKMQATNRIDDQKLKQEFQDTYSELIHKSHVELDQFKESRLRSYLNESVEWRVYSPDE